MLRDTDCLTVAALMLAGNELPTYFRHESKTIPVVDKCGDVTLELQVAFILSSANNSFSLPRTRVTFGGAASANQQS